MWLDALISFFCTGEAGWASFSWFTEHSWHSSPFPKFFLSVFSLFTLIFYALVFCLQVLLCEHVSSWSYRQCWADCGCWIWTQVGFTWTQMEEQPVPLMAERSLQPSHHQIHIYPSKTFFVVAVYFCPAMLGQMTFLYFFFVGNKVNPCWPLVALMGWKQRLPLPGQEILVI